MRAQLPELRSVNYSCFSVLALQLICERFPPLLPPGESEKGRAGAEGRRRAGAGWPRCPGALGRSSIAEPGAAASLQSDEICADSFWQVTRRCCTQSQVKMGLACPFAVGFVLQTNEQIRVLLCA